MSSKFPSLSPIAAALKCLCAKRVQFDLAKNLELRRTTSPFRLGMAVYMEHLDVVKKLAQARLDETEHAVLVVLLLLLSTREVLPMHSGVLSPLTDSAFCSLWQHCERTYEDVALRLDTMLHLAHELQVRSAKRY